MIFGLVLIVVLVGLVYVTGGRERRAKMKDGWCITKEVSKDAAMDLVGLAKAAVGKIEKLRAAREEKASRKSD